MLRNSCTDPYLFQDHCTKHFLPRRCLCSVVQPRMEKYAGGYLVTKRLAATLLLAAVGLAVAVGLITYYAGPAQPASTPQPEPEPVAEPGAEPEPEAASGPGKEKVRDVRLPVHLAPLHYTVDLVPFIQPDNFTIRGYTEIGTLAHSYRRGAVQSEAAKHLQS